MTTEWIVNGERVNVAPEGAETLLDVLRERLGLVGAKQGCGHGQCGACTVLLGERRILACLQLAAAVAEPVTTIEGLSPTEDALHPLQRSFYEADAYQCGYCTPGQIMSALGLFHEGRATGPTAVREGMSGNLCRCAAYPNIVTAILAARDAMEEA